MKEDLGKASWDMGIPVLEGNLGKSTGMAKFRSNAEDGEESRWNELGLVGCTKKREMMWDRVVVTYAGSRARLPAWWKHRSPLTDCVTMAKLLNLSVPQFSHL